MCSQYSPIAAISAPLPVELGPAKKADNDGSTETDVVNEPILAPLIWDIKEPRSL